MARLELLTSLLANDSIAFVSGKKDWQAAVRAAFEPLIKSGSVQRGYVDAVIASTNELGPYYLVSELTAMPHAQDAVDVCRNAFALSIFEEPVVFENDPRQIRIFICLAAKSAEVHTAEALPQIAELFGDVAFEQSLAKCKKRSEVVELIKGRLQKGDAPAKKSPPPLLQIALDNLTVAEAIAHARQAGDSVDIVEAGTILIASEGAAAIKRLREAFPGKILVADGKIADAGAVFAKMFFDAGADFTTCICAAETPTIASVLAVGQKYEPRRDAQVELTSHFTWVQAEEWRGENVSQVVYHRSRDSQAAGRGWSESDVAAVRRLSEMGFKVTVTGGVAKEDLHLFAGIPIYIFIAGRSIRDAANPAQAARALKDEIQRIWK